MQRHVTVFGAGSWGTALTLLLAANDHSVTLWDRDSQLTARINDTRINDKYLTGILLPASIRAVSTFDEAISDETTWFVVAVPSAGLGDVVSRIAGHVHRPLGVISAAKGLDALSGKTMSETIAAHMGAPVRRGTVVLSGPNLAGEVARGIPTVCISASEDLFLAREVQTLFMSPTFRVYTHSDVKGVELGGALKNVLAIGAGISDGLGYGDNTKAAMMTRGLMEMTQMGVAAGARPMTFLGIAGVGDLMATAASRLSRNYRVGLGLAEGKKLDEILAALGQVAEGVPTALAAREFARRHGLETPLFDTIHDIIHEGKSPLIAVNQLMSRPPREEFFSIDVHWPGSAGASVGAGVAGVAPSPCDRS